MADLELHELHYTKADLAKIPEHDRTCYLMATGLANDVLTLFKMFALAIADDNDDEIIKQGNSTVALLLLRHLAGRLWEGRAFLRGSFEPIAHKYEALLSPSSKTSLEALRAYFEGNKHLIARVRNGVAFHADRNIVRAAFDSLPEDAEMGDYFGKTVGDTLYYSAEMLHYEAIHGFAGRGEQPESVKALAVEVKEVAIHFNTFVFGYVSAFLKLHMPEQYRAMWDEPTVLTNITDSEELKIPFFMILP